MLAAGKYDAEAEKLRHEVEAQGLILIVVNGSKGTGLSVKSDVVLLATLPNILRHTADLMEDQVKEDVQRAIRQS